MSQAVLLRGPLHHWQKGQGASWIQENGWDLPSFSGDSKGTKQSLVCADESPIGKFLLEGEKIAEIAGRLDLSLPQPGRVASGAAGQLYSIRQGQALLLCPLDKRGASAQALQKGAPGCGHVVDLSSALAAYALGGKDAPKVLSKLFSLDFRSLPADGVAATGMQGYKATLARHGEAYRILVGREDASDTWAMLQRAGHEYGLATLGWVPTKTWLWSRG
jgi:heterotetrameric sarcosine oxidase gamma subunit